jgi:translation initiation factor IF-3
MAKELDADLVLLVETANPPVAKILDFNKFLYEEKKKEAAIRSKSKKSEVKQLNLSLSIGEGDIKQRMSRAKEFLAENNKVKFVMKLKRRELNNLAFALDRFNRIIALATEFGSMEENPKEIGGVISVTFTKKSK